MNDEWNRDPAKWQTRPLHERLEMLRKYHCTGPSGQCATIQGSISALDKALREAMDIIASHSPQLIRCECGSQPRFFGEAMMQSIMCDNCNSYVSIVQETGMKVDIKQAWNAGVRGWIEKNMLR